ncbi:imidazolonepropionase [Phreatobacter aquaticus]|uniref:Imidazolonepropionase n=1 Tax=Phreatobacter aquaticus TaxID=2570229 RepID=A0A4D7QHR9_9HYPH|nr:imidazolonepropionase [Phreatobacter aquaticus]QCK85243.1 imidazolonepropionase [Phreatobacter aquaticus]
MQVDRVFTNCRVATMAAGHPGLGTIDRATIAVANGLIAWIGPSAEAPALAASETIDLGGRWVTPGLIDCHTHIVFAGDRSDEFERRLAGETYADIARSGGGIAATVRATRAASENDLVRLASARLDALAVEGVTTVEVKSGYGLDVETELRQLRAAGRLLAERAMRIEPTFLGAHAVPPDMDRTAYLDRLCNEMIPRVAAEKLAGVVDAFQESIAFSADEVDRVFTAARAAGLKVKLHADQLTDSGGAALAARHQALSADHLEYTSEAGAAAMAEAGTVAVILPGAFFMLKETQKPPIEAFRKAGVSMAVASDLNPGSAPIASLRVSATMACVLFGMTVEEVMLGMTRHAAKALGRSDIGTLETGKRADLAVWSVDRLAELVAKIGPTPLHARYLGGI